MIKFKKAARVTLLILPLLATSNANSAFTSGDLQEIRVTVNLICQDVTRTKYSIQRSRFSKNMPTVVAKKRIRFITKRLKAPVLKRIKSLDKKIAKKIDIRLVSKQLDKKSILKKEVRSSFGRGNAEKKESGCRERVFFALINLLNTA